MLKPRRNRGLMVRETGTHNNTLINKYHNKTLIIFIVLLFHVIHCFKETQTREEMMPRNQTLTE